jgi:hypothetical protein
MPADRAWLTDSLRKSLAALALPGLNALDLQPRGSARADELALDFDNFYKAYRANFAGELSDAQLEALAEVDRLLSNMSRADSNLWEDQAVINHPLWAEVRNAAYAAMESFGWAITGA